MKTRIFLILVCLGLASCYPEERLWWSPQGDRALVQLKDGLHVMKADGTLGPVIEGAGDPSNALSSIAWLPDGSGFICQRERKVMSWDEVRTVISKDEAAEVEALAPAFQPMLEAAARMPDKEKSLEGVFADISEAQLKRWDSASKLAYSRAPEVIEKLMLALHDGAGIAEGFKGDNAGFRLHELCVFKLDHLAKPRVLRSSLLQPTLRALLSPKHPVIAFLHLEAKGEEANLEVMPLEGGESLVVKEKASAAYDWMPDGRTLVIASPMDGKESKLMSIQFATPVQKSGALMKPQSEKQPDGTWKSFEGPDRFAGPQSAATVLTVNQPRLQALPDGRVLLACQPITLPMIRPETELDPRLYLLAADHKSITQVPSADGALPSNLDVFVASPDGRRVAVVESYTDAVAIVDLASGKTEIISPAHPRWECTTAPAWKSPTELTFAALHGSTPPPQLMLWTTSGDTRCLSESWPKGSTESWLKQRSNDSSSSTK
ncbi:MAG: hypothetical protein JNM99_05930 [Verrucomicrobiaceae bacterium]|nr:hypothetical protein [Verrucomicrobiaceae bacterium]